MVRKYFGTDGIRGRANGVITPELALKVGQAAGTLFRRVDHRHRVVIGKDTRLSGYMIETALVAGFTSVGMDVLLLGPMPTPAVAMLTRSMRADLGVMISASHNPFADNGIKLFGPDGYKLSDEAEQSIERRMEKPPRLAKSELIGRARRIDDARGRYVQFAKDTFPEDLRLDGLKVVVDCANGAAYHVAPEALWELGAEVIPLGVKPDGLNINDKCGSTHPELMQEVPREAFQGVEDIQPGMQFQGHGPQGVINVTVVRVDDDKVHIDGNHPLAGQTLHFNVEVTDVRQASAEELAHGHVHGAGGHHH